MTAAAPALSWCCQVSWPLAFPVYIVITSIAEMEAFGQNYCKFTSGGRGPVACPASQSGDCIIPKKQGISLFASCPGFE